MKMKLLLVLLVAVGLMAGAAQANMLLNPSFEEGTFKENEPPADWLDSSPSLTSNMTWIDDTAGAHSGERYIKMNSWWSYGSSAWCWQTVNVTPDQEHAFSVWAKCSVAGEMSEAWAYYEYLDSEDTIISEGWLPWGWDVGSNWTYAEFGTATAPALATRVTFSLAGVLENGYMGVLFDDAHMDTPLPCLPFPPWESFVPVGDVDFSWTNLAPNAPATSTYVEVLFGTEPNETDSAYNMVPLTLDPASGQDVTLATAEGLTEGRYYWRVDSYLYGDPADVGYDVNGTDPNLHPIIKGYAWNFDIISDAPPSAIDVGPDMVTWTREPVNLDATVVDDSESELTYTWSLDAPAGAEVLLQDPDIEDPTITITNISNSEAAIINASFEDRLTGWDSFGVWNGTWNGVWGGKTYIYPTDGDMVAYLMGNYGDPIEGAWLSQTLAEALTVDTTYTLTVKVVDDGVYSTEVEYKVQLLAGETVMAEDDNSLPLDRPNPGSASDWATSTVVYTLSDPSDPNFVHVGEPLGIRLVCKYASQDVEVSFDDVHLTADPPFPIPEFTSVELTLKAKDTANPTYVLKDTMTIDVHSNPCAAAKAMGLAAENPGDFDGDCDTDLADLAEMAEKWLNDTGLKEAVLK